jgi:hypothetical protein
MTPERLDLSLCAGPPETMVEMELEEARQVVTSMCRRPEEYATVDEGTWAHLAETEKPFTETEVHDGVRMEITISPADWDTRLRAIFAAPKDGSEIKLAEALTVVWRKEDAQSRVAEDLVREVEGITGEPVFRTD